MRLDQLLVTRGLAKSRAQAQALILAGRVHVAGLAAPKAGALVPAEVNVTLKELSPFVSRGGEKLAGALDHFNIDPAGKVALDAGASTGGLPIACLPAARLGFMQWTWAMGNWTPA